MSDTKSHYMDTGRGRSTMNVALWVVQGLLAALFLFAGGVKLILQGAARSIRNRPERKVCPTAKSSDGLTFLLSEADRGPTDLPTASLQSKGRSRDVSHSESTPVIVSR